MQRSVVYVSEHIYHGYHLIFNSGAAVFVIEVVKDNSKMVGGFLSFPRKIFEKKYMQTKNAISWPLSHLFCWKKDILFIVVLWQHIFYLFRLWFWIKDCVLKWLN